MLKPLVSKFRSDLSVRFRDIAEKQVPVNLRPIVKFRAARQSAGKGSLDHPKFRAAVSHSARPASTYHCSPRRKA